MSDINEIKVRQLDLMLLTVFSEAMRHRKLSVVAERLGLTQSAISHSLKRLRQAFGDELFMRRPFGVEPTQRALEIAERIERIITLSRDVVGVSRAFVPAESDRIFRIAGADHHVAMFAPALMRKIREGAPGIRLSFRPQVRGEALKALADGDLDVSIGFQQATGTEHRHSHLFDENYRVILRKKDRATRPMSLKPYLASDHVLVSFDGAFRGIVDASLSKLGKSRRVVATVPSFFAAFAVVAATDCIATVPARVADLYAGTFGLANDPPPLEIRSFAVHATWHRRQANDAGLQWMLSVISEIAGRKPV